MSNNPCRIRDTSNGPNRPYLPMTQAQNVETRLREMILNMELGPGERLTERWAEAQLGAWRRTA